LLEERHALRKAKSFERADAIRIRVEDLGYQVRDTRAGSVIVPVPAWLSEDAMISSSRDVSSFLDAPPEVDFTVSIVARDGCRELERCVASVRRWLGAERGEIIVVDNGFEDECVNFIDGIAEHDERTKVFHADHFLGSAAARNVSLKQARGRYVVFMDTSVEPTGDIFEPIARLLEDESVGVAGRWGVVSSDLRSFEEAGDSGDVDAVEGYLMGFRREVLRHVGFLDEKFRFYRHLDLDFSFAVRSRGYRAVVDSGLPVTKHDHVDWNATPHDERERLSKRNFYRFLQKWGERTDLLVTARD
jgi:cysteinyl-tRNA synthetase